MKFHHAIDTQFLNILIMNFEQHIFEMAQSFRFTWGWRHLNPHTVRVKMRYRVIPVFSEFLSHLY